MTRRRPEPLQMTRRRPALPQRSQRVAVSLPSILRASLRSDLRRRTPPRGAASVTPTLAFSQCFPATALPSRLRIPLPPRPSHPCNGLPAAALNRTYAGSSNETLARKRAAERVFEASTKCQPSCGLPGVPPHQKAGLKSTTPSAARPTPGGTRGSRERSLSTSRA